MPTPVLMPKLGDIMTEGTVARWLVPPGQAVQKGAPLMEVATDKITFEVPAVEAGVLHAVLAEGQVAPVGGLVGYLLAPGEAPPPSSSPTRGEDGRAPSPQPSPTRGEWAGVSTRGSTRSASSGQASSPRTESLPLEGGGKGGGAPGEPVRATPAARRLAKDLGVDIERVTGTGPAGRVTEDDVRRAAATPSPAKGEGRGEGERAPVSTGLPPPSISLPQRGGSAQPSREPPLRQTQEAPFQALPLTSMRRLIAQRMHGSLQGSAQLSFALETDVTDLVAARRQYLREHRPSTHSASSARTEILPSPQPSPSGRGQGEGAVRLSYTHLIIKAAVEALVRYPRLNAAIVGDELHVYQQINVGFAVALDEGLLVPVVRDAGGKTVEEIGRQVEDLLARAQANRLTLDELTGGTFTVSVLGTVDSFTPILNPPEVALLGVGRFVEKPAVHKGEIAKRTLVTLSLTVDHRAVDGAPAAAFLRRLRQLLESPAVLFGAAPPPEDAGEDE